jgi:membrane protein DedA with SNARE-associated domain
MINYFCRIQTLILFLRTLLTMEDIIKTIIESILPAGDAYLYAFLFLFAVIENLFPPVPGDMVTAFGAFLVGTGRLNFFLVYFSTTLGSVAGFVSLFFVGRYLGREFFVKKNYKVFSEKSMVSAETWFRKYGYFIVLANRFMPGIRSVISIFAGISMLNPIKVTVLSLISAFFWNMIWIYLGYTLGNNWDAVRENLGAVMKNYNLIAGAIIAAAALAYVINKLRKRQQKKRPML